MQEHKDACWSWQVLAAGAAAVLTGSLSYVAACEAGGQVTICPATYCCVVANFMLQETYRVLSAGRLGQDE